MEGWRLGAQLVAVLLEHLRPEEMGAYVANTLTAPERASVEQHLTGCSECRTELIEGRRAVATAPSPTRVSRRWYGVAALAAAAAILVAVWPARTVSRFPEPVE